MTANYRIFTQYCEDVRHEADGRQSMMGIFPITLPVGLEGNTKIPRIFVQAVVSIPAQEQINSLKIVIKWNGKTINEVPLPDEELQKIKQKQLDQTPSDTGEIIITAYAAMCDIEAEDGGELTTSAAINGTEVKGRPLRFHVEQPQP